MEKVTFSSYDTPEQISMCLSCKQADCSGSCLNIRQAAPPPKRRRGSTASSISRADFAPVLAGEKTMRALARELNLSSVALYKCRNDIFREA